jgi:hypothetical protein
LQLYFEDDAEHLEINKESVIHNYKRLKNEIPKFVHILPLPVDYEEDDVHYYLETFLNEFVNLALKDKDEELILNGLADLTDFAVNLLRIINEYETSGIIYEITDYVADLLNKNLKSLYSPINFHEEAKYYYKRWLGKCEITNNYRPISFLNDSNPNEHNKVG